MDTSDKIKEIIEEVTPATEQAGTVINNISVHGNSFITGSPGTKVASEASSIQEMPHGADHEKPGEMEAEMVRVFRWLTLREKTKFMQGAFDFEDACKLDRERKAQEEQEK